MVEAASEKSPVAELFALVQTDLLQDVIDEYSIGQVAGKRGVSIEEVCSDLDYIRRKFENKLQIRNLNLIIFLGVKNGVLNTKNLVQVGSLVSSKPEKQEQERNILLRAILGKPYEKIGEEFGLTKEKVEYRMSKIYNQAGCRNLYMITALIAVNRELLPEVYDGISNYLSEHFAKAKKLNDC